MEQTTIQHQPSNTATSTALPQVAAYSPLVIHRHSPLVTFLLYLWVLPATLFGLVVVGLTAVTGGSVQCYAGAIEAWSGIAVWIFKYITRPGCAMTLGHVIIGLDEYSICRYRQHEHVHIEQYERWGPLFVPLYVASSLLAWVEGKNIYHDNVFEQEAYRRCH